MAVCQPNSPDQDLRRRRRTFICVFCPRSSRPDFNIKTIPRRGLETRGSWAAISSPGSLAQRDSDSEPAVPRPASVVLRLSTCQSSAAFAPLLLTSDRVVLDSLHPSTSAWSLSLTPFVPSLLCLELAPWGPWWGPPELLTAIVPGSGQKSQEKREWREPETEWVLTPCIL